MAIAFFDLDKTLLSLNSGSLWVRRELKLGHITRLQALRAAAWMIRYQMGFASLDDALRRAIGLLHGISESAVRQRTLDFYEQEVRWLFRGDALKAVQRHRKEGARVVLLTASSLYLSELVARELRLDAILCNRFEVDKEGLHTGRSLGGLCFGSGKLDHARAYAREAGISLNDCTFYTDSYSDLPVLLAVGQPVAVNPDRRLRREAFKRGWAVVRWGDAAPPVGEAALFQGLP